MLRIYYTPGYQNGRSVQIYQGIDVGTYFWGTAKLYGFGRKNVCFCVGDNGDDRSEQYNDGDGGKYKYDDSDKNNLSLDVPLIDQLQEGKSAHCYLIVIVIVGMILHVMIITLSQ